MDRRQFLAVAAGGPLALTGRADDPAPGRTYATPEDTRKSPPETIANVNGWNACASCHGMRARRYLILPGLVSGRIHVVDTADPKAPKLHKVIEPDEVVRKTKLTAPARTNSEVLTLRTSTSLIGCTVNPAFG